MDHRIIKVTGKGKLAVRPDTVRLIITQSKVEKTYDCAILESAKAKEQLTAALTKLNFANDALKTQYFNVDTENESYQDKKDNCWKTRRIGYRYTHRMKLEFSRESEILGAVLGILSESPSKPEFSIEYTVKDTESKKNELLAIAVADSTAKALVLSKAANVSLGEIIKIDYSWGEIEFVSRPMDNYMLRSCNEAMDCKASVNMDIEPEDIDVTDTVTVVWEIH